MKLLTYGRAAVMLLALFAAVTLVVPAMAVDQDQIRDQDRLMLKDQHLDDPILLQKRDRLRDQISKDTDLTAAETAALDPELTEAIRRSGDTEPVRKMVRIAAQNDCKGECLREMLRIMSRAMERNATGDQAQKMVCEALQERLRTRERSRWKDGELCQQIQEQVQAKMQIQLQNREQYKKEVAPGHQGEGPGGDQSGGSTGGNRGGR
jgi:hypothetical protein